MMLAFIEFCFIASRYYYFQAHKLCITEEEMAVILLVIYAPYECSNVSIYENKNLTFIKLHARLFENT